MTKKDFMLSFHQMNLEWLLHLAATLADPGSIPIYTWIIIFLSICMNSYKAQIRWLLSKYGQLYQKYCTTKFLDIPLIFKLDSK